MIILWDIYYTNFFTPLQWLPESARFDIARGDTAKALKTLERIAKDNNKPMPLGRLVAHKGGPAVVQDTQVGFSFTYKCDYDDLKACVLLRCCALKHLIKHVMSSFVVHLRNRLFSLHGNQWFSVSVMCPIMVTSINSSSK